jgi:hypothetical protein
MCGDVVKVGKRSGVSPGGRGLVVLTARSVEVWDGATRAMGPWTGMLPERTVPSA